MAAVIVILIIKGDWHFILKFLSDFTQGILIHSWLSLRFSVLGVAGYVMFFGVPPACREQVPGASGKPSPTEKVYQRLQYQVGCRCCIAMTV